MKKDTIRVLITATVQFESVMHKCSYNEAVQRGRAILEDATLDLNEWVADNLPIDVAEISEVRAENLSSDDGSFK